MKGDHYVNRFWKKAPGGRVRLLKLISWLILAAVMLALPAILKNYMLSLVSTTLISIIAITGLNLLTGYTGLVSLGSAAFLGIGGFSAGIFSTQLGLPFLLAVIASGLFAMGVGILIGIPSLRLKGLYLMIATLALHYTTQSGLINYQLKSGLYAGLQFPRMEIAGFLIDTGAKAYYFFLVVTVLVLIAVYNFLRTALGRSFVAVRDNESAAKAMGVNVTYAKLTAFAISSFLIGMAGALMGFALRNITADIFSFDLIINHLVALFVGGQATLFGPVLGAAFITLFPTILNSLANATQNVFPFLAHLLEAYTYEVQTFIYGLCIVLVLIFKPTGLAGILSDLARLFKWLGRKGMPLKK
jgi:branched-chain amino acid transport system permease protein